MNHEQAIINTLSNAILKINSLDIDSPLEYMSIVSNIAHRAEIQYRMYLNDKHHAA